MINKFYFIFICTLVIPLFCFACASSAKTEKAPPPVNVSSAPAIQTQKDPVPVPPKPAPPPAPIQPVNPFYKGMGGKGISLAILAPQGLRLSENLAYLPALVQGVFVSNFSGYSAISVLDRENLDKLFAETLSGYYADDVEGVIRLGHMANTDYIMTGSISSTSTGYALQMQISSSSDGITKASYSGTCTIGELDNFTGIHKASLDLLTKMDIELTDKARAELAGAANTNQISAQTALAQGITAERGGTVVEALAHYYEAVKSDSALKEATNRLSVLSTNIASGNIGVNVRNDIQRRNEWITLLNQCGEYFLKNPPIEVSYNPVLSQEYVNYEAGTAGLSFEMKIYPTDQLSIIKTMLDGLKKTGKKAEWGFTSWPLRTSKSADWDDSPYRPVIFIDNIGSKTPGRGFVNYEIAVSLINSDGKIIGTAKVTRGLEFHFYRVDKDGESKLMGSSLADAEWDSGFDYIVKARGDGIFKYYSVLFSGVNANDITDSLVIKIDSIKIGNRDVTNSIKISSEGYSLSKRVFFISFGKGLDSFAKGSPPSYLKPRYNWTSF